MIECENAKIKNNSEFNKLDSIWLKAAIVGGLWASVEIILGSFLHNLRIPFSGSILASFGIILLVSFSRIWQLNGLIWRAGLICALMKSVSPSAIIFGPMINIFVEAILLEIAIFVFGKNLFGYIIGGSMSLLSILAYKIIYLLIFYGYNIVNIFLNIFKFATEKISIPNADPWVFIFVLVLIYIAIGTTAASLGFYIGKLSGSFKKQQITDNLEKNKMNTLFQVNEKQKFSLGFFSLHIIAIPSGLYLIQDVIYYFSFPIILIYVSFCIYYYKQNLKRLKKPIFWGQLVIITILAGMFWKNTNLSFTNFSTEGLMIGLKMDFRAALLVISFSVLSVELRNPVIKGFLFKKGFRQLYLSLSLAFSALPIMIGDTKKTSEFFRNPIRSIAQVLANSEIWFQKFENQINEMNKK
ncbi:MAG: hypothetical protein U9R15_20205 [Chloroflexota bacterium]|nr:hypothetical protein [Chloroflexota bacterium]